MAQQNDEHFTIEQLSAYLDKQLSPQEAVVLQAHLQTCQQCQGMLAGLQQTVSLLHALPKAELPRSFVLPRSINVVAERPVKADPTIRPISRRTGKVSRALRFTIRTVGSIAAVLGLFVILSGLSLTLPHFGTASSNSAASSSSGTGSTLSPNNTSSPGTFGPRHSGTGDSSKAIPCTTVIPATPVTQPCSATRVPSNGKQLQNTDQPVLPPLLDLSQPAGHVGVGFTLFIVGILAIIFTRRRRRQTAY